MKSVSFYEFKQRVNWLSKHLAWASVCGLINVGGCKTGECANQGIELSALRFAEIVLNGGNLRPQQRDVSWQHSRKINWMHSSKFCSPRSQKVEKVNLSVGLGSISSMLAGSRVATAAQKMGEKSANESTAQESKNGRHNPAICWLWHLAMGVLGGVVGYTAYGVVRAKLNFHTGRHPNTSSLVLLPVGSGPLKHSRPPTSVCSARSYVKTTPYGLVLVPVRVKGGSSR
jgi:hypothetical protein